MALQKWQYTNERIRRTGVVMRFRLRKSYLPLPIPPYKRRFTATLLVLALFCIFSSVSFYMVDFRIRPTLAGLAEAKAKQIATLAVNEAIRVNISPNIRYQNLITLNFDKEGKVSFMQPNTGEINRIASESTIVVQNRLKDLPPETVKIPIGQIIGLQILAGIGPLLPVEIFPVGVVTSSVDDSFDVAGINQIRHRIFVTINATVKIVVPLINREVKIAARVPLVETVIMGDVPGIYVSGGGGVILPGDTKTK